MSDLVKVINVCQLEADLLAESPLSEDVDWASDTSSDLPELGGEAVRAVLEELSLEIETPQETTPDPSTVPIRASEVRVERMKLTPQQQTIVGKQLASKKEIGRQKRGKKNSRRQQRWSRYAAAPSRSTGHRYLDDWMPHRGETEETQEYLDRIFSEGKLTPEQFCRTPTCVY